MASLVSVIICTRNRSDNVVPTANAILKNYHPSFEVVIVDQSTDELTAKALAPLCAQDSRVRYVKSPPDGKSAGLNLGAKMAQGEYLALTDDDCEPDPGWLTAIVAGFHLNPKIGCIFGDVKPGPHDSSKGYVPALRTVEPRFVHHLRDYIRIPERVHTGMGANMAVKAEALAKVQGFDPCLSAGGRFNGGEESDLAARMLLAGYDIFFSPEASTTHFGFRELHHLPDDFRRWSRPRGAAFAKHLRLGVLYRAPLTYLWFYVRGFLGAGCRLRRPPQESCCIPAWFGGFFDGLFHPIDRQKKQFRPVASGTPARDFAQVTLRDQIPVQKD
jgi:GT2 family glycosyltransferase